MGSKSGDPVTTTITDPRATAQLPFLQTGWEEAQRYLGAPGNAAYFPGQAVAPFSRNTQGGIDSIVNQARRGLGSVGAASSMLSNTLSGNMLGKNPFLDAQFAEAEERFRPQIDANFGLAGRTGSFAHGNQLGDAYAQAVDAVYGQHYENERGRQMQAASLAPGVEAARFVPGQQVLGVGGLQDIQQQRLLDEQQRKFNFERDVGPDVLRNYLNLIGQPVGQLSTQSQNTFTNPALGALGGAASGAGIASLLGLGGPWGAVGGGLLGLLGGL